MKDCGLKLGQAYDCIIDGNLGIDKTCIVPLAINAQQNRRFMIFDARTLHSKNPRFLNKLLSMQFSEIVDEDLDGGDYRQWSSFVWNVTLIDDGGIYYNDCDAYFRDFVEVDLS